MHDASLADPATAEKHISSVNDPQKMRGRYDWLYGYDAVHTPLPLAPA